MTTPPTSRPNDFLAYVGRHYAAALGLGIALVGIAVLFLQTLIDLAIGEAAPGIRNALLGGAAGFAATALGALPALLLRGIPQKLEDSLLGMAAGMMLAASAFSLILPGIDAGEQLFGLRSLGAAVVVLGMALGVLLMLGLERFVPHAHDSTGPCGPLPERCGGLPVNSVLIECG